MLLIVWLCALSAVAQEAQRAKVVGIVVDDQYQEPLTGVTVKEKGSTNGTITDVEGNFSLETSLNATLVFSYMGFAEQEVSLNGRREVSVIMVTQSKDLEELVVIGYGVQRKSDVTGSIASVSGKDLADQPVAGTLQALQGRAAGVTIIQNTGAPGSATTIRVRGTGTVNDSDPLYVVDGFVVDDIDYINTNDIENVEIFKDAASSAIYGSRAANGVVAITTKTGKEGRTKITYDGYVGISSPWKKINVMGLEDYALMRDYVTNNTEYSVDGKLYMSYANGVDASDGYIYDEHKAYLLDTIRHNGCDNWWDAVTQTGIKHQHTVSVSGGTNKFQYLASASYYNEKGIVQKSNYARFNGRVNVKAELARWLNMTANISYASDKQKKVPEGSSGILLQALYESPMTLLYNNKGYWYSSNPIATLDRYHSTSTSDRLDMNLSLDARICKYLMYQFKASYYTTPTEDNSFTEVAALDEDFTSTSRTNVYVMNSHTNKWEVNNLLTFMWNNDVHNITVLVGQTLEGKKYNYQESSRQGTPSNADNFRYLSSAYIGDKTYGAPSSWTAIGYIGRVNYSVLDTYLLQANIRADGSSMFSKANRWGVFPSVSVGWKFSNEPFMKNVNWLSMGKLRFGWGRLGNNRINILSRYTYLDSGYNYSYGIGIKSTYQGVTATVLGNDDIKWESSENINVGIDLGFFNSRLQLTVEYFNRKTSDMLLRVPTVNSAGLYTAPMTNAGAVKNFGWEADVKWRDHVARDWSYEVGFNISWTRNRVTSLGTGNEPIYGAYVSNLSIADYITKTEVGMPIGAFYGYVTDGIFNTWEEVEASAQYEVGKNRSEQTTRPGDFRFKDLNGDGQITAEDRTYIGSPHPDFVFGVPLNVSYKGWTLDLFFQGQVGNDIFNVTDFYLYNAASGNVYSDIRSKQWSDGGADVSEHSFFPANLNGTIPDLSNNDAANNFRASDFFVKDGSYVRLKQLSLAYNFPQKILSHLRISQLQLSFTAYNLLTITGYDGLDPEVGKVVGTEGNNLSLGIDFGNYPQARTFTFGLKLGI